MAAALIRRSGFDFDACNFVDCICAADDLATGDTGEKASLLWLRSRPTRKTIGLRVMVLM